VKSRPEGFRWRSNLLPQSKEDIREDDAVFRREAIRFQAIDICIHAGDLPLQLHYVAIGIRLPLKQFLQVAQRALRIGQAGFQVSTLLSDFIRSFLLPLDLADSFQLA
jgi:NhaP-type Na+/H+ and K+/H+ antiporter